MPEITKEMLERQVHKKQLAIAKIAALALTGEDVLDDIFRICKDSTFEYMIKDAYMKILENKVKEKLKEVCDE